MQDLEKLFIELNYVIDERFEMLKSSLSRNYTVHNQKEGTQKICPICITLPETDEFKHGNILVSEGGCVTFSEQFKKEKEDRPEFEIYSPILRIMQLGNAVGVLVKIENENTIK